MAKNTLSLFLVIGLVMALPVFATEDYIVYQRFFGSGSSFNSSNVSSNISALWINASNQQVQINSKASKSMLYWALSGNNIYNNNSGNVGIGLTVPTAKLEVQNGAVLFNGTSGATPETGAGTRFMWIPSKFALRAGKVGATQWDTIANGSVAFGENNIVVGAYSLASGGGNTIGGSYSFASGISNNVACDSCSALGSANSLSGGAGYGYSNALGQSNLVTGFAANSLGSSNSVIGDYSACVGSGNIVEGNGASGIGYSVSAVGEGATAIGYGVSAYNLGSTAIGSYTQAIGANAISIGKECQSNGDNSMTIGFNTVANSAKDWAIGIGGSVTSTNTASALLSFGTSYDDNPTITSDNTFVIYSGLDKKTELPFFAGIGGTNPLTPQSQWSVYGESSIGESYYSVVPPNNGMIIEGDTGIGTNAPNAKLEVIGTTRLGDGSNYQETESDGTLVMYGTATVWDDVYTPLTSAKLAGGNDPDFSTFRGTTKAYSFADNVQASEDEVFLTFQMPHGYKLSSSFTPHLHWSPSYNASGNAIVNLNCTKQDIGSKFPEAITELNFTLVTSGNDAYSHNVTGTSTTFTCSGVSCVAECRLRRLSGSSADTYNSRAVFIHALDWHIEMDTIGSRSELSK